MPGDSERLPAGWTTANLGSAATITLGGTPSTDVVRFWGGEVPWMSSGEVHKRRIESVDGRITEAGLASSNATLVDPPSVAVALAGQGKTRGAAALVRIRLCTNQSVALVKGRSGTLDASFLFHELDGRYEELRARSSGGGRAGLSRGVLAQVPLLIPPMVEQRRIAEILDSVDDAILATEQLIAKLDLMKQGLLHDLLTRGIDDNGELRDPRRHPAVFKDSILGPVPSSWEVVRLADKCRIRRGASPRPIDDPRWFAPSGPGWVRIADVTRAQDRLEVTTQYLSDAGAALSVRVTLGQVIMSIAATVGLAIVVGIDACIHDGFVVFDNHAETIDADFLALALQFYRPSFIKRGQTGTQANINTKIVESTFIALPRIAEQLLIVGINEAVRSQEQAERLMFQKLRLLKRGLMEDLLTGRVRVTKLLQGSAV